VLKVKIARLLAVTAVCFVSFSLIGSQASAQVVGNRQPVAMQPAAAPNIALLDVSYIFKNHPKFKNMMDEMKSDVENAEANVNRERETLRKLVEQIDGFRKGTPDYKSMEEEIARREADLSVKVQLQRKEFLLREAKIYHTVYQEISQEVDYYCANKGIDMVLRFNGDPVDENKPDSVLSNINKPVVYYNKNHDITPIILDSLVKRGGGAAPGNQNQMTRPPVRPGANTPFQK
jgi:Skp family chaperone for outer membrane proteins